MDRRSAMDRLFELYEDREIFVCIATATTGQDHEDAKDALKAIAEEIRTIHKRFPPSYKLFSPEL